MNKRLPDWAELPEGREAVKHAAKEIAKAIEEDIIINVMGSQFRFIGGDREEIKSLNIDMAGKA